MSMSNIEHADFTVQEREATMSIVAGGSFAEAIGGIGAVVLAILGLVGVMPEDMAAIVALNMKVSSFFDHRDPQVVKRLGEAKRNT